MPHLQSDAFRRPYLVIPKLIEQPTWGGTYIVQNKGWQNRLARDGQTLGQLKIGQAYELFSGSNLSLLGSTDDPAFTGELATSAAAATATRPQNSVALAELIQADAAAALGQELAAQRRGELNLLLKFTQALGNSFQAHLKAGLQHPKWKPKPESWYYFEPGIITLGVKPTANWAQYEQALRAIAAGMAGISQQVKSGGLSRAAAETAIQALLETYDPWQYVNSVATAADDLIDLSCGALHHSWEEDPRQAPLGNVLYELQSEAMDNVSTFRGFDKGKMAADGSLRPVQIDEYFAYLDRTPEVNNPAVHMKQAQNLKDQPSYRFDRLLDTPFYSLEKLAFTGESGRFTTATPHFQHIFVKDGRVEVAAGSQTVTVGTGHSAYVPAGAGECSIKNLAAGSQILISY